MLGIWWRESEGAKFWLAVLNDLHQRGVRDVLICCVDGLEGFPEAIEAVFPQRLSAQDLRAAREQLRDERLGRLAHLRDLDLELPLERLHGSGAKAVAQPVS